MNEQGREERKNRRKQKAEDAYVQKRGNDERVKKRKRRAWARRQDPRPGLEKRQIFSPKLSLGGP